MKQPIDPEEASLLAAIGDAPDDVVLRLAYADWLEERGDPRTELMRVQCALAGDLEDAERDRLEDREAQILKKSRAKWVKALPELDGVLWGIDTDYWTVMPASTRHYFSFGRIEAARVRSVRVFTQSVEAFRTLGIFEFQLPLKGSAARQLAKSPFLPRIRALVCHGGEDLEPLLQSPDLRCTRLHLDGCPDVFHYALPLILEAPWFANLRWLGLSGSSCTRPWIEELARASHLEGLAVGALATSDIGAWSSLPRLRELSLSHALDRLTRAEQNRVLASHAVAGARSLALDHNRLTYGALETLLQSLSPNIRQLSLSSNELTNESVIALARSPNLASLQWLDLGHNEIGDAGAAALAKSPYLTNLRILKLTSNPITEVGGRALAASPHLNQIELIRLRDTRVEGALPALQARFGSRLKM